MNHKHLCLAAMFLLLLLGAAQAQAAKSFAVLPFEINGPDKYKNLGQGIQTMLTTRLTDAQRLVPVDRNRSKGAAPGSQAQAQEVMSQIGCDYLIWGSVTILGDQASLDLQIRDASGGSWTKSAQTKVDGLIPALENVAKDVNAEIFRKPTAVAPVAAAAAVQPVVGSNPEIIANSAVQSDQNFILNPDISYEGGAGQTRWTSQGLNFSASGAVVGDCDGSGRNAVFILGNDNKLHAYWYSPEGLRPAGEWQYPTMRFQPLKLNILDLHHNGTKQLILSGYEDNGPLSTILNFKEGVFTVEVERLQYFLHVVRIPPDYVDTLVAQQPGHNGIPFDKNYVHEAQIINGSVDLGRRLKLPDHSFIYNIAYFPQDGGDYKILNLDSYDHIRIHTADGHLTASTDERYLGSSVEITFDSHPAGLGVSQASPMPEDSALIPLRMIALDPNKEGKYQLLVNRDVSAAAEYFARYHYYPQGEIQALVWDGVGMSMLWKTRPIKGSVADYGIADINNDGKPELWVCVNSHPGLTGMGSIRTSIIYYPMDFSTLPKQAVKKIKMSE